MKARRPGLLVRLLAATLLAGVLAGAVGAIVQWRAARDALRTEITERNAALAVELAARLDARVEAQTTVLALVGTRRSIAALEPDAQNELRSLLGSSAEFDELVLYDRAGQPVAAAASRFVASAVEQPSRPGIEADGPVGATVELLLDGTGDDGSAVLEIAVPVSDPPGTPTGILVGRLPLEVVVSPALSIDTVLGTTRFMTAADGRVIAHPERDRVLRQEEAPVADLLATQDGADRVEVDGDTHLLAAAPMVSLDAVVLIDQLESAALSPIGDQLRELTLILGVVLAATILAVSAAGTWLLAPLAPLVHAVRRLGRRESGVRVEERSPGEVGALAREFNRLAETLDRRQEELDELQRLSLLVNTRTSREAVAAEVVDGAARLLRIDQAAFCMTEGDRPELLAVHGDMPEGAALEMATTAIRIRRTHVEAEGSSFGAAVHVESLDGRSIGALVVVRRGSELESDEVALAEAYGAFAGVALENVARLALEQRLAAELADAVEQRRSLMSTVSHEFRTPLTCIQGFSSALLDHWETYDDPRRRELVEKIRHHSGDLEELVNRLLDFAVTERGTLAAEMQPVPLLEVVRDVTESSQPILADRPLEVDVPDLLVQADRVLLRRALSNLLSNAAKYSPAGSTIAIRAIDDGRRVRLEVTDEGAGLAAADAAQAFRPFWRSGDPATRSQRGAGLGLALVAEYAQAMGGAPGVVSEPGHGSTFFITLQRAEPALAQPSAL